MAEPIISAERVGKKVWFKTQRIMLIIKCRSIVNLMIIMVASLFSQFVYAQETKLQSVIEQQADTVSTGIGSWGAVNPGKGFLIGKTKYGTLNISAYMLARYMNQLPASQSYYNHLGQLKFVDPRNDILWHRVQAFLVGWIYNPKLNYNVTFWTVNATNQVAIAGSMAYDFAPYFILHAGINALPGTRSLEGSHPYWLGTDRVLADEYFRPGFTSGLWATGQFLKTLHYNVMLGDNLSELGITAGQLTRNLGFGASVWWLPSTGEFGPRGAYGDWEWHEKLATRFGFSSAHHRENRFSNLAQNSPDNTAIRLSDATLFFEADALDTGVTVIEADYNELAVDAGLKYKGFFFQTEYYYRRLNDFFTSGTPPMDAIYDHGFMIQLAGYIVPKKLELYGAMSQIFGQFNNASEGIGGLNFYPFNTRNMRLNGQVIVIGSSPVSSVFGYYTAGQSGTTISVAASIFF